MGLFSRLDEWMWGQLSRLDSGILGSPDAESHAIDPKMAAWAADTEFGNPVWAGINVTQQNALKLSVVRRCIQLISETLAGLPADVVRKRDGVREPVDRPPAWLESPNPESTWFEFVERIFESLLMDGNAFVVITARDAQAFPSELWTLNPQNVEVRRRDGQIRFLWNGTQWLTRYGLTNPGGDVLHIKLASAGGLRGLSPIEQARQSIGLGLVTEKFGARFFGRGQTMSGVIQIPPQQGGARETKEHIDLIGENWETKHGGSDQSHRPGVLTGGATWQGITIPPEHAQFIQTRGFQVEDIASRVYGIPPHLVGLTEKQTSWGTGVEQQGIGLYRFTLRGHLIRFEQAMSLLVPRGQFLRLNPRALLEADSETEAKVLEMELRNGIINFNDWRAILDKPPRPGGDRYTVQTNNQTILEPNGLPPEPAPIPAALQGGDEDDQEGA